MTVKLFYLIKRFGYNQLPNFFFKNNYLRLKKAEQQYDQQKINFRLNYYLKLNKQFNLSSEVTAAKNFKRSRGTDYYLDLKDFLHYFTPKTFFSYRFGDETTVPLTPTLVKARPINGDNNNSVLFKLNKKRHFKWVNDPYLFKEKKDLIVWRGGAYRPLRREFVEKFWNNPFCNIGQTNKPVENVPWQKEYLSIDEQLQYKFIFCPEGNDVATNLKWVMSSNSLCFMPKPKYETWFMEGTLQPGIHYVETNSDYSNLEELVLHYSRHPEEALQIIKNAHEYVDQFRDKDLEDLLCLKVLEKYIEQSGQENYSKFNIK